jgi:hypothetical protein
MGPTSFGRKQFVQQCFVDGASKKATKGLLFNLIQRVIQIEHEFYVYYGKDSF